MRALGLLICSAVVLPWSSHGITPSGSVPPDPVLVQSVAPRDGRHDFDFEIGTWNTRLSRRLKPLTGSSTWVEYEGTSVVRKVWDGKANLVELDVKGLSGRLEGLSLRLYNPESTQWSLNFSNSAGGTLSPPVVGEFRNGRGAFFGQEFLNGRMIYVRFVISDITPSSCRFEQAFSDDGGKTWEVNWIAVDTRVTDASASAAIDSRRRPRVQDNVLGPRLVPPLNEYISNRARQHPELRTGSPAKF